MGRSSYFQKLAGQIGRTVPTLAPPRYLARRIETAQVETFMHSEASQPMPLVSQPAMSQTDAGNFGPRFKKVEGTHVATTFPVPETVSSNDNLQSSDSGPSGARLFINSGVSRHALDNHHERPFQPAQLPKLTGNSPAYELPGSPVSSEPAQRFALSLDHTPLASTMKTTEAYDARKPGAVGFDPADQNVGKETPQPPQFTPTNRELHGTTDRGQALAKENKPDNLSVQTGFKDSRLNGSADKPQLNPAMNEGVAKFDSGRKPAMMEPLGGANQKSRPDNGNEAVRIGVLEITVVSPSQSTQPAMTGLAANKLSGSRGILRAYGLRQG